MKILFSDPQLAAAVKPYGALSESDSKKPNMPAILKEALGCEEIYPVHRLDRTTQGLIIYAKTPEAAKRLSAMAQNGEIEKIYLAVVEGLPDEESGALTDLLYYDRQKNKSYAVKRMRKGVKEARLSYEIVGTSEYDGKKISLLRIRLQTGRTHQIRVQFASRKMPVAGDRRYGSTIALENIMLCSSQLSFRHPFTGEELRFEYNPDDELFGLFI